MLPNRPTNAPYGGLANLMAMKGRMGDTALVHMSQPQVSRLEALGAVSQNPATGLPEARPSAPVGLLNRPAMPYGLVNNPASATPVGIGNRPANPVGMVRAEGGILRREEGGDLNDGSGYADYGGGQAAAPAGSLPGEAGYADYGGGQAAAPAGSLPSDIGYGDFDTPWGTGQSGKYPGMLERGLQSLSFGIKDIINNPAASALNFMIGGIPLVGIFNTLSGMTTGKTLGGAITSGIRDITGSTETKYSPSFVIDAITGTGRGLSALTGGSSSTSSAGSRFIGGESGPALQQEGYAGTLVPPIAYGGYAEGGVLHGDQYHEGMVDGRGDGQSDHVPFGVEGGDTPMALLSRDEYVLPADVVAMIGSGSSNAGAERLDKFVKSVRKESYGTTKQMPAMKDGGISALINK